MINITGTYEAQIKDSEKLKSDYLNLINDLCYLNNSGWNNDALKDRIQHRLLNEILSNKLHLLDIHNADNSKAFIDIDKFIDGGN